MASLSSHHLFRGDFDDPGTATNPKRSLTRRPANLENFLSAAILGFCMLDRPLAAFLQEGVGIHVGTCNQRLEPNGARGLAVTVDGEGAHLVVYVAEVAATRLLPDLAGNGRAAVSFGRPIDDRACQVKGDVVSVRPAEPGERELIRAQFEGYLSSLERIGIASAGAANWVLWPAVAIRLRATAVFEQTPGPAAGTPIS
jgi:hypothetical protein